MIQLGSEIIPNLKNVPQTDTTTLSTTEINTLVNDESTRAQNKEQELLTAIANEETRATTAENNIFTTLEEEINTKVSEENQRALSAEGALDTKIDVEISTREAAITQEVSDRNTAIKDAIEALDVPDASVQGQYITQVSEVDGKIVVGRQGFSTNVTQGDPIAPSGGAIYNAIQNLGALYRIKPSVETVENLPTEENKAGDCRNVNDTGDNYVWDGEKWDRLGGSTIINGINYDDPAVTNEASTEFISNIYQTNGQISATKKKLPTASTTIAGISKFTNTYSSDGTIPVTGTAVSSAISGKANASNITAGTFGDIGGENKTSFNIPYISVTSQGIVNSISNKTVTIPALTSTISSTETKAPTSKAVYDYVQSIFQWNATTGVLNINL